LATTCCAIASAAFGPGFEALVVYNSNPVAVAPESARVVQGFAREDLFTVVLEHFMTDTADHADYVLPATTQLEHWDVHMSYGHTDVLLNRPAIAPVGEARSNTEIFRALAQRMGFATRALPTATKPCAGRPLKARSTSAVAGPRVCHAGRARRALCRRRLSHAVRPVRIFQRPAGRSGPGRPVPDHVPNYEPAGSSARYPLAMISPPARNFLNSTFVNVTSLRSIEGEPLLEIHATMRLRAALPQARWCGCSTTGAPTAARRWCPARARPGVVNGLGIWWRKLGMDGTNVNQLTSQKLTDLGRAPVFYDCLVEVAADRPVDAVQPALG
jgi:anaerobic selenocysteine-containing dehydrogenase